MDDFVSASLSAAETSDADFTLSSSLPPMVTGAVTGELELSIPCLFAKPGVLCPTRYLRDGRSEPLFAVRVHWWGESGPGTVFKPKLLRGRDEQGRQAQQEARSKAICALFPVRCGLDAITAYLQDMVRVFLEQSRLKTSKTSSLKWISSNLRCLRIHVSLVFTCF